MIRTNYYWTLLVLLAVLFVIGIGIPGFLHRSPEIPDTGASAAAPTPGVVRTPEADPQEVVSSAEPALVELVNNCTYPFSYWQDRVEDWPEQVVLGGKVYSRAEMRELLSTAEPDVQTRLIQQIYTAFLNILNGANYTVIESLLFSAASWLDANTLGSQVSEFSRQEGLAMAQIIEKYNEGEIGPGPCP